MDKSNPYIELDPDALAQACDVRAGELQARAWRTEDERNALREATADLLDAVARQLARSQPATPVVDAYSRAPGSTGPHEVIVSHVHHLPLHTGGHVRFAAGSQHASSQVLPGQDEPVSMDMPDAAAESPDDPQ